MKVENVRIYDLEESLIAAGYPMRTSAEIRQLQDKDIKRGHILSKACDTGNGAHGQFMTGIRVNFDLTFTNKAWIEAARYRFLEFVSSQSTMHCMTLFDLSTQYNEYVDPRIIEIMKEKVIAFNDYKSMLKAKGSVTEEEKAKLNKKYLEIIYSNPAGFNLTARMTTNYRCLKNIYIQRKNHKLPEWQEFCKWIETLPYFEELINTNHYEND